MDYIDTSAIIMDSDIGSGTRVFKNAFVKKSSFGENCLVSDSCRIEDSSFGHFSWLYPNGIVYSSSIGDYSYAQKNASIWHTKIGKFCSISWNVSIGGGEHDFHKVTSHSILYAQMYGFIDEPLYNRFATNCSIGNDVWIGAGAHILRDLTIGDGAVIGAGAVVTKDVEPYSIVAGVPAKKIGQRCDDDIIEELLQIKWWDLPEDQIKKNIHLFNCMLTKDTIKNLSELKKQIIK